MTCVADAAKVYFQADTWTTVNAYAWGASGDVSQGWPGDPMTKNDATGLWEVEFSTTPENIIFNSNGAQTKDLKFKDGATYKQDGSIVGEDPEPPTPVSKELYLVGENYGTWQNDEAYKMTREDNVYTITLPEGLSGEWKIWDGTWDYTFGAGADQPVAGTATDAWFKSSANFSLNTTAKTTVTFTLVEGSDVENSSIPSSILVEVEEGPVPPVPVEMPEHLYIVGNVNGASWDVAAPMELQKDGNTFRATGVTLTDAGAGSSYFTFITATGTSWDEVNGSDRYGAPAQDTPVTPNEPAEVTKYTAGVNASAAQSWIISSSLEAIDIVVDFENMTMTVTRAAGIDSVADGGMNIAVNGGVLSVEGASDVHVFTAGGALVSTSAKTALAPGLYIVVANGNAAKVMVK